jgi:hypothetical protein
MDLYWQFCASWDTIQGFSIGVQESRSPPVFKTFVRRWKQWRHLLAIRKSSQHAECCTCFELKRKLHQHSSSWGDKIQAARDLRSHYQDQYLDRCIYWSLRWCSRSDSRLCVIILDGMDKAKFAFPKFGYGKISKDIADKTRPRAPLTAAYAHGHSVNLFLTQENQNHGADLFCELLCQVLNGVKKSCMEKGREMPEHLIVVTDNTVSWSKNTFANQFFAYLVGSFKFRTVSALHLMVGHTHEDIDQLFSVCTALLNAKKSWQTPTEILEFLRASLLPKAQRRGEAVMAMEIQTVRDFSSWLRPLRIHLHGAFMNREGVEAPHSFSYKRRSDLAPDEMQLLSKESRSPGVPSYLGAKSPNDVMCCVKTYMRDTKLQQAPVLVLPAGRVENMKSLEPETAVRLAQLSSKQINHWLELADICQERLQLPEASKALRDLVKIRDYPEVPAGWLGEPGTCHGPALAAGSNPFFPHLPKTSFELLANLEAPDQPKPRWGKKRKAAEEDEDIYI